MRPSILSLLLAFTATVVVASPKLQYKRKTNGTTSGGCRYQGLTGPDPSNQTIWNSCICDPTTLRAWVYNLTTGAYPPCTPHTVDYTTSPYPSVEFFSTENPALANCASWEAAKGTEIGDGTLPQVEPYTGLCAVGAIWWEKG